MWSHTWGTMRFWPLPVWRIQETRRMREELIPTELETFSLLFFKCDSWLFFLDAGTYLYGLSYSAGLFSWLFASGRRTASWVFFTAFSSSWVFFWAEHYTVAAFMRSPISSQTTTSGLAVLIFWPGTTIAWRKSLLLVTFAKITVDKTE